MATDSALPSLSVILNRCICYNDHISIRGRPPMNSSQVGVMVVSITLLLQSIMFYSSFFPFKTSHLINIYNINKIARGSSLIRKESNQRKELTYFLTIKLISILKLDIYFKTYFLSFLIYIYLYIYISFFLSL